MRAPDVFGRGVVAGVEGFYLVLVEVLARVGRLVLERFDQAVQDDGEERAEGRADPVDPMIAVERVRDDVWAEGARGVQAAAGEVDACG